MNKHKSRYKLVIYDCDGVMLDSLESNYVFYDRIMNHLGRPSLDRGDQKAMSVLHTYSFQGVMNYFLGNDPEYELAMRFAKTVHYCELSQFMRREDGLIETLERLKGEVSLAVCTNREISMEMIIEDFGLSGYFDYVMTAAKVKHPKPHPEPLLKLLEYFSIEPHEALFIGDGEVDMLSAKASGVHFVSYKSNLPGQKRIEQHGEIISYVFG